MSEHCVIGRHTMRLNIATNNVWRMCRDEGEEASVLQAVWNKIVTASLLNFNDH